jgi:hypothetical protein
MLVVADLPDNNSNNFSSSRSSSSHTVVAPTSDSIPPELLDVDVDHGQRQQHQQLPNNNHAESSHM